MISGPAPSHFTDKIYELTTTMSSYSSCTELTVDIGKIGETSFEVDGRAFSVEVIDGVSDYKAYMKELFDFDVIKQLFSGENPLQVRADAMNGGDLLQLYFLFFQN